MTSNFVFRTTRLQNLLLSTALAAIVLSIDVQRAKADVVLFSDLGTGSNVYQAGNSVTILGKSTASGLFIQGYDFTSAHTAQLARIDVALTNETGGNGAVLDLDIDDGGSPGLTMYSFPLLNLPQFGTCCTLETAKPLSTSTIILTAGQRYWLVMSPYNDQTVDDWDLNSVGATGDGYFLTPSFADVFSGQTLPAFDVVGTAAASTVPEPTSVLLLGLGLTLIASRLRRRSA